MERSPLVWAVVLNWNRPEDTIACVASLRRLDYPSFRILIVDNGSTDGSAERFRALAGVDLLACEANLGFAAGNNRGIEYALERGADYVLLLNNDTTVAPSMVSELVRVAQSHPRIGIVGPTIFYSGQPDRVWFSGMHFRHGLYVVRRGLHLGKDPSPIEEVDFVSGCGMLGRREMWREVGLFDTQFFMYYEDLDLCIRAAKAGYRIACATQASMWHTLSASSGGPDSPLKQYHQIKSTFLFTRKHTRGLKRWLTISLRLGHAGLTGLRHALRGQLSMQVIRLYMKGMGEARHTGPMRPADHGMTETIRRDPSGPAGHTGVEP